MFKLCSILSSALRAVGKRPNCGNGKFAPLWTNVCKIAHLAYQIATTDDDRSACAKKFESQSSLGEKRILEKEGRRDRISIGYL